MAQIGVIPLYNLFLKWLWDYYFGLVTYEFNGLAAPMKRIDGVLGIVLHKVF
jgi:hypothetical protein